MVEFSSVLGAIGLEALFQQSRGDARLVPHKSDREHFARGVITCFLRPETAIGLLQTRQPIGFPVVVPSAAANGVLPR